MFRPSTSVKLLALLGLMGSSALNSARGADDGKAAAPIELPKVVVEESATYQPLERDWFYAEVPGFRVYTHGQAAVARVVDHCQTARRALQLIWPQDAKIFSVPTTIVICKDEAEFFAWSARDLTSLDPLSANLPTDRGPALVINGANPYIDRALNRLYILGLLSQVKGMPRWLAEGLAQICKNADFYPDGRLRLEDQQANDNDAATVGTRSLEAIAREIRNPGANGHVTVPTKLVVDGLELTDDRLLDYITEELERRETAHKRNVDIRLGFAAYFDDGQIPPLTLLFDPHAPDTPDYRMIAWEFLHINLYGFAHKYTANFTAFLDQLNQGNPTETAFRSAYGQSMDDFRVVLRGYSQATTYQLGNYRLKEKIAPNPTADLHPIGDREILPLKAELFVVTGRRDAAKGLLATANTRRITRSSESLCREAALTDDPAEAQKLLETAIASNEPLLADGYAQLAQLRFKEVIAAAAGAPLSNGQVVRVFAPLFKALSLKDTPESYRLIADVWLAASAQPTAANLDSVMQGVKLFPRDAALADAAKRLQAKVASGAPAH